MSYHPLPPLDPRALIGVGLASALAACAGGPRADERRPFLAAPTSSVAVSEVPRPAGDGRAAPVTSGGEIDPAVLLPSVETSDDVVARVGGFSIHKRHVYEHLRKTEPAAQRTLVESVELNVLVAQAASAWDIRLDAAVVARQTAEQQEQLREVVERQLGGRSGFGRYIRSQFGMTLEQHAEWLRDKNIRALYRQYVVRYAALLEDRVEVRYIVNADRLVLEDIAAKVRQGASFATLALRHTEDGNKLDRGLLPPFGRSFDHPVTAVALGLDVGQLSDIFISEVQGSNRYYLVYCLRKLPGRAAAFAEVREQLEREIETQPLTELEFRAGVMCLKARMETLNSGPDKR